MSLRNSVAFSSSSIPSLLFYIFTGFCGSQQQSITPETSKSIRGSVLVDDNSAIIKKRQCKACCAHVTIFYKRLNVQVIRIFPTVMIVRGCTAALERSLIFMMSQKCISRILHAVHLRIVPNSCLKLSRAK